MKNIRSTRKIFDSGELLQREQLKSIFGGYGTCVASCCGGTMSVMCQGSGCAAQDEVGCQANGAYTMCYSCPPINHT